MEKYGEFGGGERELGEEEGGGWETESGSQKVRWTQVKKGVQDGDSPAENRARYRTECRDPVVL